MKVAVYDATLREGAQNAGIAFSLEDKIKFAKMLDDIGVAYIEAGNPGSNPKDAAFYEYMAANKLKNARLVAFGATCRIGVSPEEDPNIQALLAAKTETVCVFGKSWDLHVHEVLKAKPEENLAIIKSTIRYLKAQGREVIYDAEHFFDGWKHNRVYAMRTITAARDAGADWIVLCDTNGGTFPHEIVAAMDILQVIIKVPLGIHCHNDAGMANAASLEAVRKNAAMVQVTVNGIGERCGNADLCSLIPSLQLKLGVDCLPSANIQQLTWLSHAVGELANLLPNENAPYVGKQAFLHKAGMHIDAVNKNPQAYEHVPPEHVGNTRGFVLSEIAGRMAILQRVKALYPNLEKESPETRQVLEALKTQEQNGYQYEGADASFELLVRRVLGPHTPLFELLGFRVAVNEPAADESASAKVEILVNGEKASATAKGNGPVNALDKAARKALERFFPILINVFLIDYKVRVLDSGKATASLVRVLVESGDGMRTWSTVGVSTDIIKASWQALVDSLEYKLRLG